MKSFWTRVGPKSKNWQLYKSRDRDRDSKREGHVTREPEIRVRYLQVNSKNHWQSPEAGTLAWTTSSLRTSLANTSISHFQVPKL
jgi:hypothetical protein